MLYPLQIDGRWGFIDERLALVAPPTFEHARPIKNGLAAVCCDGFWGFLNTEGRLECPAIFRKVGVFDQQLCWVQDDAGFAVIGRDFKVAFRITSGTPVGVQEGITLIKEADATYSYIKPNGNVFLRGNQTLEHFGNGLVAFQSEDADKFGFKDLKGKWAIRPQFESATGFSEQLAAVAQNENGDQVVGFIGPDGAWRIPCQFHTILPMARFHEGRALIWARGNRRERVGYIDTEGAFVIEPQFSNGQAYSGGLAAVESKGRWGWIDLEGKWVCQPQFESVGNDLSGSLIWAQRGKVLGYYSRGGKLLIKSDPFVGRRRRS